MRKKTSSTSFLILVFFLFSWVNLPKSLVDEVRSFAVASLAPTWKWGKGIKKYLSDRPDRFWVRSEDGNLDRVARLELENQTLRSQIERLSEWMASERRIKEQIEVYKNFSQKESEAKQADLRSFFERRALHMRDLLKWELMAIPARAIYRDPNSWSSSLWINVGEEDNRVIGRDVIAKNSPVVAGTALVGVVEYVGKKQSRVRLITDSGLSPSVRAVRGTLQEREIGALASALSEKLEDQHLLRAFLQTEDGRTALISLKKLQAFIGVVGDEKYLAKGELHGSSAPLWRARGPILKGIGFNLDYPDEDGADQKKVPILKVGDSLVTTGLDGVFPPDLLVGKIVKVDLAKSGGYTYEIEAKPAAMHLNDLDALFVLPPRGD